MRFQAWNPQGQKVQDVEITRVGGIPTVVDYLNNTSRPADSGETELLLSDEAEKANQTRWVRLEQLANQGSLSPLEIMELLRLVARYLLYLRSRGVVT